MVEAAMWQGFKVDFIALAVQDGVKREDAHSERP
jgi:hypothetical protein